jgi:putative multiple sugar transport system substrate-binding protein
MYQSKEKIPMKKKIASIVLYGILVIAMLTAFVPAAELKATNVATKMPPTPTATKAPTPTQIPGVGPGGKIPVGIILLNSSVPFFAQGQASLRAYLRSLGYTAQIQLSQNNLDKEKSIVESMIKQGVKVIILHPVDERASAAAAQTAKAAGVKVISYDRLIQYTTAVDFYTSFDGLAVGQAQGQYLIDHTDRKGVPLYLYSGSTGDNNAYMFFKGAWSVLQPKIVDGTFVIANSNQAIALQDTADLSREDQESIFTEISVSNWDPNNARKLAKSNLIDATVDKKGDVAILAPNDNSARAISDIFKADKEVKSFLITGQDADNASLQYIRSGRQTMTVFKDSRVLAKVTIDAALAFLAGQTPVSTTTINNGVKDIPFNPPAVVVVDKSNVNTALK